MVALLEGFEKLTLTLKATLLHDVGERSRRVSTGSARRRSDFDQPALKGWLVRTHRSVRRHQSTLATENPICQRDEERVGLCEGGSPA